MQENTENYVPTLNNMGYVTKVLDEYCEDFIKRSSSFSAPVADLGVGFGFTTKRLLDVGAEVYANDIDEKHLKVLQTECSPEQSKRLHLVPGKLPEAFNHKSNSLSGILASRCFHFLYGHEIESLASAMYESLHPGGVACVVAETPYLGHLTGFIPVYEKRKKNGETYPGYVESLSKYTDRAHSAKWVNLLDPDILRDVFTKVGFLIEKVGFISRTYFPKEVQLSGRESAGIIAVK